jgi:hypothetical protein
MRSFPTKKFLGATLLVVSCCIPANAFCVVTTEGDADRPNTPNDSAKTKEPAVSTGAMSIARPGDEAKAFVSTPPADLKLRGFWVGNMQYKVGESSEGLFIVNAKGLVAPLPGGTQLDSISIPFDNPFVQGIMHSQPVASQETQIRSDKNGGMGQYFSNPGVLTPTFMATRTMIVDGKAMVVGGPVICEYVRAQPPAVEPALVAQAPINPQEKAMKHSIRRTIRTAKKKQVKKTAH